LSKLENTRNGSIFVPGGRAYFEAEVMGYKISSFTSRGIIDKLNYKEPIRNDYVPFYQTYFWSLLFTTLLLGIISYLAYEDR